MVRFDPMVPNDLAKGWNVVFESGDKDEAIMKSEKYSLNGYGSFVVDSQARPFDDWMVCMFIDGCKPEFEEVKQ